MCGTRTLGNNCQDASQTTTLPNQCGTELQKANKAGSWCADVPLGGEVVFIETSCDNHLPKTPSTEPGVALTSDLYQQYANFWGMFAANSTPLSIDPSQTSCLRTRGLALSRDCAVALSQIIGMPNGTVPSWDTNINTSYSVDVSSIATVLESFGIANCFNSIGVRATFESIKTNYGIKPAATAWCHT